MPEDAPPPTATAWSPERILVRAPNWIGDAVLSLGALRDIHRNYTRARLTLLARPWVADVYRAAGAAFEILTSADHREDRARLRARAGGFDLAILLPNSFASAWSVFAARIPERWGYATDGRGILLTRRARVPRLVRGESQVYYYRAMLAGLGLIVTAVPDVSLACPADWSERAAERLAAPGPWVVINPGAAYGSAKRWLPARFAAVGDGLAESHGARIAIVGSAKEREIGMAVAAQMRAPALVLSGETSLHELIGVLNRARLLVTNDSGPMHLAAALGRAVVAIFGPTDPSETAPVGARARIVRETAECAPCRHRECPTDHRCMERVTGERVLALARQMLE